MPFIRNNTPRRRTHPPTPPVPPRDAALVPAEPMTGVSLFAGIGGFDLAMQRAGVRVAAAVEIDAAARGVLADRFPETRLFNDVTEVTGDQLRAAGFVPERGIITAGFPCQDLSVAGRRGGLGEGTRSGLFWHIDRLVDELRPAWVVLENVPGLLSAVCPHPPAESAPADHGTPGREARSARAPRGACEGGCMPSHGGAMGLVLGALADRGYGFAYRVLDAQFFGVPQRRRRVFVVGRAGGDARGPVEVLLEPESSSGHPAPRRQARPRSAGAAAVSTLTGGGRRGHRVDAESAAGGHLIAMTITTSGNRVPSDGRANLIPFDASQITSASNGANPQPGDPAPTLLATGRPHVAHTLTSSGHDASEDGTGRGTPLVAAPFPVAVRGRDGGATLEAGQPGDPAYTLRTPGGGSSHGASSRGGGNGGWGGGHGGGGHR